MVKRELYHHGILGQKWGVRRFQNKDGTLTSAGRKRLNREEKKDSDRDQVAKGKSFVESYSNQKVSHVMEKTGGDGIEIAIRLFITSLVAAYGGLKLNEYFERRSKKFDKTEDSARTIRLKTMEEFDEYDKTKAIKSFANAPRLSKKMNAKDSMKITNPDYPSEGTTSNCIFCTTAMVLREKGYDVRARKYYGIGFYTDLLFERTFNSPEIKMSQNSKPDDILKTLGSNGDGAYGNLTVFWNIGGSHSVFWKNENGKTHIYDAQSGKEVTNNIINCIDLSDVRYSRLDNCEPTEYALATVERNNQ